MKPFPLFQPPTALFNDDILTQALLLEESVIRKLDRIFPGSAPHTVLFGAELEFFVNSRNYYYSNPRSTNHAAAQSVFNALEEWDEKHRLLYQSNPLTRWNGSAEARTAPLPPVETALALERLGDFLTEEARKRKLFDRNGEFINPYSLHISCSISDSDGLSLLYDEEAMDEGEDCSLLGSCMLHILEQMLHNALPLSCLPKEIDHDLPDGVQINGRNDDAEDPLRIECRLLNSEWAAHPRLSVLLILAAMDAALDIYPRIETTDDLMDHVFWEHYQDDFQDALSDMETCTLLAEKLTPSLLQSLIAAVSHYPNIQEDAMTVKEARAQLYRNPEFQLEPNPSVDVELPPESYPAEPQPESVHPPSPEPMIQLHRAEAQRVSWYQQYILQPITAFFS